MLQAVDELLAHHIDACQVLACGVGSALCVAASTQFENRRAPEKRIALVCGCQEWVNGCLVLVVDV